MTLTCLLAACSQSVYVPPSAHPPAQPSATPPGAATNYPSPSPAPSPTPTTTTKPTATPTPTSTPSPVPTPTLGTSLYVVDSDTYSIHVFPLSANGNVPPSFSFGTQSVLPEPVGAAFDASGNLYVANASTNAQNTAWNVVMYKPPFGATSTPASTLSYSATTSGQIGIGGLAIDPNGNLYVLYDQTVNGQTTRQIFVFAPGASGNASPIRTITPSISDDYFDIAVDASNIYVNGYESGRVYEIPIGSSGAVYPAVLGGNATGLTSPEGLQIDDLDRLVVRNGGNGTVSRFAAGASGNVAPLSTIDVSAFSMNDDTIAGEIECLDGGGNAFLPLNTTDSSGNDAGSIGFFPISDSGSVSPSRTIGGSMTDLGFIVGCVVR